MWGKARPPKNNFDRDSAADQALTQQLEELEYQADPQFQRALRQRLVASFEHSAAQSAHRRRFNPAWGVGLALSGLGVAALVVVFVSVLSVRSVDTNQPTALAVVASVPPEPTTALDVPTIAPSVAPPDSPLAATSIQPVGLTLYNPANQTNVSATQAVSLTGFTIRQPAYLPAGYALEGATVQTATTRPEPASVPVSGYYLRYSGPDKGPKPGPTTLEISQWKVPFSFRPIGESRPTTTSPAHPNPRVIFVNTQRNQNLTIQGQPAALVQGANWRINIISTGGPERPLSPVAGKPGFPGFSAPPPPAPAANNGPVSFGRLIPGQPDYYVEFGRRGESKNSRALVWQKDEVLHVVNAADNLTPEELQKVAESLHE